MKASHSFGKKGSQRGRRWITLLLQMQLDSHLAQHMSSVNVVGSWRLTFKENYLILVDITLILICRLILVVYKVQANAVDTVKCKNKIKGLPAKRNPLAALLYFRLEVSALPLPKPLRWLPSGHLLAQSW